MFFIAFLHNIKYTKGKKRRRQSGRAAGVHQCLGCTRECNFEPTFTFMGLLYRWLDVRPPFVVEGRRSGAVTHLALLGVKIARYGILGMMKRICVPSEYYVLRGFFALSAACEAHVIKLPLST